MTHDVTVYKTPALDLPLDELIAKLQDKFGAAGMLDGLVRSTVAREVSRELYTNREVFREVLLANWEVFFPGVSIIDVDLDTELDTFIEEKRSELTAILHNYVMKRAVVAGTPSLGLLLSAETVQKTSEFPCNGKPHDFVSNRSQGRVTQYIAFIISEKGETHYIGTEGRFHDWWNIGHSKKCGKQRRRLSVTVDQCKNCTTIEKVTFAWFQSFCESCGYIGYVRKIKKPTTSPYVQQILLLNGLTLHHT